MAAMGTGRVSLILPQKCPIDNSKGTHKKKVENSTIVNKVKKTWSKMT